MSRRLGSCLHSIVAMAFAVGLAGSPLLAATSDSILNNLKNISLISTTIPGNNDVNPYGLVKIPRSVGRLYEGSYLVSNFNNNSNQQGTGTTIVEIAPNGSFSLFAEINPDNLPGPCPGGVGLTTALAVLQTGWVIAGSLPTTNGNSASAEAGCLLVLNANGHVVETFYGSLINGPWDMTLWDGAQSAALFVTNVLNGTVAAKGAIVKTATVVRVNLTVSETQMPLLESITVIGDGFPARTDPVALVLGPTGVGLSPACDHSGDTNCWTPLGQDEPVLYVNDTLKNRIAVITNPLTRWTSAGTGATLTSGGSLNAPLGLTVAPDGHVITVNGNDGYAVETTPEGQQIAKSLLDNTPGPPPGVGALFGVLYDPAVGLIFVDDDVNTLNKLH